MNKRLLIVSVCFLLIPAAAAAESPDPVSMPDLLALLEAGVGEEIIARQVRAGGSSFSLGVAEILELKRAGASDALIEHLMGSDEVAAEAASPRPPEPASDGAGSLPDLPGDSFRIFMEKDEDGREYLHITNLDSSGRRIGGPAPARRESMTNPYEQREAPREPAEFADDWEPVDRGNTAPVVVNVFPPPQDVPPHEHPERYRNVRYLGGYGVTAVAGYPAYHPYGPPNVGGIFAPPGSYSHFVLHHGHESRIYNGVMAQRARYGGMVPRPPREHVMIGPASARESITRYRQHFKNRR